MASQQNFIIWKQRHTNIQTCFCKSLIANEFITLWCCAINGTTNKNKMINLYFKNQDGTLLIHIKISIMRKLLQSFPFPSKTFSVLKSHTATQMYEKIQHNLAIFSNTTASSKAIFD